MTLAPTPTTVHTVADLIMAMMLRFPKHHATIEAWSGSYRRTLGHLSAARLEEAWFAVIDEWAYREPPKPADFKAKLGGDSAPTDPRARESGRQMRRVVEDSQRRDRLARKLVDDSLVAYAQQFETAAKRANVAVSDLRNAAFNLWGGYSPTYRDRAYQVAAAHVHRNDPLPDYLKLSDDDWHRIKAVAESKRDHPQVWDTSHPDFGSVTRPGRSNPQREERRREAIDRRHEEAPAPA